MDYTCRLLCSRWHNAADLRIMSEASCPTMDVQEACTLGVHLSSETHRQETERLFENGNDRSDL